MVQNRSFKRASYFVIGYFALLTGGKISEKLRRDILEAASWQHEEGYWSDSDFAIDRKAYLEDFREKIRIHKPDQKLHSARFKHSTKDFKNSQVVIGIEQFRKVCSLNKVHRIIHINLDGWNLKTIPEEIFNFRNLKGLSLEFNQLEGIPNEISSLKSLKYLYLNYNDLSTLPDGMGDLISLKELNIAHNNIIKLPETLKNLKNLNYICVRETGITKTPKILKNFKYDDFTQTLTLM